MDCKHCLHVLHEKSWRFVQDTPKEIRVHLEQCPSCYAEFQWLSHSRQAFSEMERIQIPVNLHQAIMKSLEPELPLKREIGLRKWLGFFQWKPVVSFAAASVLVVTLATMHFLRPEPVQTMELLQPEEPPTAMKALTKEEAEPARDSMNMMLVPTTGLTEDGFIEISLEINAEGFASWEAYLIEKEFPYQQFELEGENQLIIEGTGIEIVELEKELMIDLDPQVMLVLPEFLLENDLKIETSENEQTVVLQSHQSYRVKFLMKLQ